MRSIGFRCWKDTIAFVVLEGTASSVQLCANEKRSFPASATSAAQLAWVRREVHEILDAQLPGVGFLKVAESIARKKDLRRSEVEGVLKEAAISHAVNLEVAPVMKRQIKAATHFGQSAQYLGNALQDMGLSELRTTAYEEAALAALCGMD